MPKVLLTQELLGKKNVRTVVDGQQRIRTILEFVAGSFTVLSTHNPEHAGKIFSELGEAAQTLVLQYEVGVDLLYNVSFSDLLDIFARINTYSVTLNTQEKLNAKYLGAFKTVAYDLGHSYVNYVLDGGVLTEKQVGRMGEAQLSSDLLVALVGGVQTVKNIERYYKLYEACTALPEDLENAIESYHETMKYIGAIYATGDIRVTNWSRQHWFYTLFTCVSHGLTSLQGLDGVRRPALNENTVVAWRGALDEISAQYNRYTEDDVEDVPGPYVRFINYAQRRTTDTEARRERAKFVLERVLP
jgi:hypothetical protein